MPLPRLTIRVPIARKMRAPAFYALAALEDGPLEGADILRRADELSGGHVRMSAGTLYGALERLVESGKVYAGDYRFEHSRPRREYRLTEYGRAVLAAEARHHRPRARERRPKGHPGR